MGASFLAPKSGDCCQIRPRSAPEVIDIQLLNECINFEIRIRGKLCSFLCLDRSPSQTQDIFETFGDNFELTLDSIISKNPFLIVALGDFNAKITNCHKNDINLYKSDNATYVQRGGTENPGFRY